MALASTMPLSAAQEECRELLGVHGTVIPHQLQPAVPALLKPLGFVVRAGQEGVTQEAALKARDG